MLEGFRVLCEEIMSTSIAPWALSYGRGDHSEFASRHRAGSSRIAADDAMTTLRTLEGCVERDANGSRIVPRATETGFA